jgi:hypothetical protein
MHRSTSQAPTIPSEIRATIDEIARAHLGFETLEARGRDHLDFRDAHVDGVRDALLAAFEAGMTWAASSTTR